MLGDSKQATSATTSLIYITLGTLIDVWTAVYYFYLRNHQGSDTAYLYTAGFFLSGLALLFIGLAVGRIGMAARPAETAPVPPPQVVARTPVPVNSVPVGMGTAPVAQPLTQPPMPMTAPPAPVTPIATSPALSSSLGPVESASIS